MSSPALFLFPNAKFGWWPYPDPALGPLVGLGKLFNFGIGSPYPLPTHKGPCGTIAQNANTLSGPWSLRVTGAASRSGGSAANMNLAYYRALYSKSMMNTSGVSNSRMDPGAGSFGKGLARQKGVADNTENGLDRAVYLAVYNCAFTSLSVEYRKTLVLRAEAIMGG